MRNLAVQKILPRLENRQQKTAKKFLLVLLLFILLGFGFSVNKTGADELEEITQKLAVIREEQRKLSEELDKISKNLKFTENQVSQISARIETTKRNIVSIEAALADRQEKLGKQIEIRDKRVRSLYKKSNVNPLQFLFGSESPSQGAAEFVYEFSTLEQTKGFIQSLNKEIGDFEQNKKALQASKKDLENNLAKLNSLRTQLAISKTETSSRLSSVETELKNLTARQQTLLAEKFGSFSTSVGEVPPSEDDQHLVNPGFAPAFAAFSFGAPHRVGMSQYGAFGRSKSGQSAETILTSYYASARIEKNYPVPGSISVIGYGAIAFEDLYLKGIGEMPSDWGDPANSGFEALKAQAIAARTYALAVIKNGGAICATESCQVYLGYNKGGFWEGAVNATRGWVIVDNASGEPITAWYASTAGGFTRSSADSFGKATTWATGIKDVPSGGAWPTDAFEGSRYGRSPWFYKAWYKPRNKSGSRAHAWLTQDEFADIVNSTLLFGRDTATQTHLSQTDKPNPDTWSASQVRAELQNRGGDPINQVSDIPPPVYSNVGFTNQISFATDKGVKTLSGGDFRAIFDLRAPGEIHLTSSLYNIERK